MAKKAQPEKCPNCGVPCPLARSFDEVDLDGALGGQRYRYPDYDRLLAGFEVVEVLRYTLDQDGGFAKHIDLDDFDREFGEWLDWKVWKEDGDDQAWENKRASDHSSYSRRRTHFLKDAVLTCGCHVTFELKRKVSAEHLRIDHVGKGCPAHRSISGWAFDMRGRCYICEWPITAYAKSYDTKMHKLDETHQAVEIGDG